MPEDSKEALDSLIPIIEGHFENRSEEFFPGESEIRLSQPSFGAEEVIESIESLLSTSVTMGNKVKQFEQDWSNYVNQSYSHMVNSGSSANLLAIQSLSGDVIEPGDEVIVPAVAWSTSLFPILDVDALPVLVDVNPDSYTIDVDKLEAAITDKTSAIMLVHLLGNPCDMESIMQIASEHDLKVIEDCCEAHGAEYDGKPVGTFGELGTFSFFFSHHITTIEGGMVATDDSHRSERVRMGRAHGWTRELDDTASVEADNPDIDPRFLFASTGYNLRPTEIQGAFGIHQLPKLEEFVEIRRLNAEVLNRKLADYDELVLFEEGDRTRCSWFAYPIQVTPDADFTRDELQDHLEDAGIETRPILAGNIANQPILDGINHRISGGLEGAQQIHENGLFLGNHHGLTEEKIEYIVDTITYFVETST